MGNVIDRRILSERIIKARKEMGMNQTQFADKAGITQAAISQIENCNRTPSTPILRKISRALNVSIDYLIGKSDDSEFEDLLQQKEVQLFFRGFQSLSSDEKKQIMEFIELMQIRKKRDNDEATDK